MINIGILNGNAVPSLIRLVDYELLHSTTNNILINSKLMVSLKFYVKN